MRHRRGPRRQGVEGGREGRALRQVRARLAGLLRRPRAHRPPGAVRRGIRSRSLPRAGAGDRGRARDGRRGPRREERPPRARRQQLPGALRRPPRLHRHHQALRRAHSRGNWGRASPKRGGAHAARGLEGSRRRRAPRRVDPGRPAHDLSAFAVNFRPAGSATPRAQRGAPGQRAAPPASAAPAPPRTRGAGPARSARWARRKLPWGAPFALAALALRRRQRPPRR